MIFHCGRLVRFLAFFLERNNTGGFVFTGEEFTVLTNLKVVNGYYCLLFVAFHE